MSIFSFLNDQLLKMKWLDRLASMFVEGGLGLDPEGRVGDSLRFFLYDTVKIFILLSILIYLISYIQSYFPPERTKKILGGFKGIWGNIFGALLGTVTPFCSCSSIPLFIGFTRAGLPIGVTFSFLISSPLVDLASVIMLASIFNWKIAGAYVTVGVVLAVIAGTIISKLGMEKYVEPFVTSGAASAGCSCEMTRKDRASFAAGQVKTIVGKVWIYVLAGVAIGAAIHNWIPREIINALLGQDKWYSVPLATLVGVPMYADIFGTLPIAEALVANGVGLGTALSFMMAVTALSLPSMIMLRKVVKPRLLALFIGVVVAGIVIVGLLFNATAALLI